nr:sugar transferase [Amylibacter sp.]
MVYHVKSSDLEGTRVRIDELQSIVSQRPIARSRMSKRVFDVVFATVLLIFFSPFMVLIAATIWASDRQKVIFAHTRVGRNGRPFNCLKFRTMCIDADLRLAQMLQNDPAARAEWERTQKLVNDPRLTAIGHFLRKTSLDELPQLWNVLRGDMSMVGPRPIVAAEAKHYRASFAEYKSVRPGLTGAWQISGRSDTTYEERVALDVDYVQNNSFIGDLKIVVKTVSVVLGGQGAR